LAPREEAEWRGLRAGGSGVFPFVLRTVGLNLFWSLHSICYTLPKHEYNLDEGQGRSIQFIYPPPFAPGFIRYLPSKFIEGLNPISINGTRDSNSRGVPHEGQKNFFCHEQRSLPKPEEKHLNAKKSPLEKSIGCWKSSARFKFPRDLRKFNSKLTIYGKDHSQRRSVKTQIVTWADFPSRRS